MSKTKLGSVLIGIAAFLRATGDLVPAGDQIAQILEMVSNLLLGFGIPIAGHGLRDAISKNGRQV